MKDIFHGFIQLVLDIIGMQIMSEVETNIGRINATVETEKFVYLMKFKLSHASTAIEQIKDRKYFQRYLTSEKQIILVGIAFDSEEKNIKEFAFENFN